MGLCETCRHWTPPREGERGSCGAIPNAREAFLMADEPPAMVDDYGLPSGGLLTLPTFGCVLHEYKAASVPGGA